MNCEKARTLLPILLDEDLGGKEAPAVRLHLEACPMCRHELAQLASAVDRLDEELVPPPVAVWDALAGSLLEEPAERAKPRREDDLVFGRIAMGWKLLSADLLSRALSHQEQQEPYKQLPEILVEKGVLTQDQVEQVLAHSREPGELPDYGRSPGDHPMIGKTISGYRIEAVLGQGGLGIVFKARHERFGDQVAIKVLPRGISNPRLVSRFERQFELTADLDHPNLVVVKDTGTTPEGSRYVVMDYVDGFDLQELLRSHECTPADALAVVIAVAKGLKAAHTAGLIHRDIKPHNILLPGGKPASARLTDFSLARPVDEELSLSKSGAVVGTPYYMSPEAVMGKRDLDHRADIYGLGLTFYYALTKRLPFVGQTISELFQKKLAEEIEPPERYVKDLPEGYRRVIAKMIAKDPNDRYPSVAALLEDLAALEQGLPIKSGTGPLWREGVVARARVVAKATAEATGISPGLLLGMLVALGLVVLLFSVLVWIGLR